MIVTIFSILEFLFFFIKAVPIQNKRYSFNLIAYVLKCFKNRTCSDILEFKENKILHKIFPVNDRK